VAVGVHNVQQADNVGVVHLLEQRDLANGGRGNALIFGFEANLLECDNALVLCCEVAGLVDNSVGSWLALASGRVKLQLQALLQPVAYPLPPSPASGSSPWRRQRAEAFGR
jgi:hypothetical protein